MTARACACVQRGKRNSHHHGVCAFRCRGGGGQGRQEWVGGPESSRAPCFGLFFFFFFFLKLEDSNACYLASPLLPGHARALSPHSAKTHISPPLDHPEGVIWEWH